MSTATAPTATSPSSTYIATRSRLVVVSVRSIVAIDHLPAVPRGYRHPRVRIDERRDEPHRAVAKEHVAAVAVLAPHLIGVPEGIVRRVDDALRVIVRVRSTMDADQAPGPVVLRRPRTQIESRWSDRSRHHPDPGLVAQNRTVLADEDRVRQPIDDRQRRDARVAVERPVDTGELVPVLDDRFGNVVVVAVRRRAAPRLVNARVAHVMRVREE